MRPVMVLDPEACVGCRACVAACVIENGQVFPAAHPAREGWPMTIHLRTWVSWQEREGKEPARAFQPNLCQHCENTPCLSVCPTGATYKTPEGVVLVDKAACIGCSYCQVACPYGGRFRPEPGEDRKVRLEPLVAAVRQGTSYGGVMFDPPVPNRWAFTPDAVDKCTFCYHRKTGDALWEPACVEVCPTNARLFGDLDDPNDAVAARVHAGQARDRRPDLRTGTRVFVESTRG